MNEIIIFKMRGIFRITDASKQLSNKVREMKMDQKIEGKLHITDISDIDYEATVYGGTRKMALLGNNDYARAMNLICSLPVGVRKE